MIEGVQIISLKRIPDERGCIYHMLRVDAPHFKQFGEIYFSEIYPGAIKGWHNHKKTTLNYACVIGNIKLVLYDGREDSKTYKELQEIFLGENNYCLVIIPPGVWNGHNAIGNKRAIIANCATMPHNPDEMERLDPHKNDIPYDWNIKNK